MSQISLLLRLYVCPLKAFSRILDEGRLPFAALAAIAVVLALQVPRAAQYELDEQREMQRAMMAHIDQVTKKAVANQITSAEEIAREMDMPGYMASVTAPATGPAAVRIAADRFTALNPSRYFSPIAAIAICFVPLVILVLARWDALGGFTTILFRDYMALLVCCLLAWAAPYLLLLLVNSALAALHHPAYNHPALWWGAHAYFLLLTVLAIRTLFGAKPGHALGAIAGAWFGAVSGVWLYAMLGSVTWYLASPCVLYYLYMGVGSQFSGIGLGLRSRQNLKRGLEIATLNPSDADAHFQLGLIYAQRRQHEPAIQCFRRSVEIDPKEPDAYYQLGRIARQQGRYAEAIEHCRAAARIDDKHSSSEVWREIGIASFLAGDCEPARQALEKYLERRPYDPEGDCWYGRTLAKLGRGADARAAFEQAIEAVRTMPPARKRQLRSWESEARRELKKLPASSNLGAVTA